MYLRKLTDDENEFIQEAKRKANKILTANRRSITAKLNSKVTYPNEIPALEKELRKNRRIIGKPVFLKIAGKIMSTDYERLERLDKLLNPQQWARTIAIKKDENGYPLLELIYWRHKDRLQTGTIVLYELPQYQLDLLGTLPVIEIS